jgi:uncharacterized protein (DUF952 family)
MIFHITEQATWTASQLAGRHTGSTRDRDLADEGFIHCSTAAQLAPTLERFYAGVDDLVVLHIDERLLEAPVVFEQLAGAPEPVPHVYGPINLPAVVRVEPVRR